MVHHRRVTHTLTLAHMHTHAHTCTHAHTHMHTQSHALTHTCTCTGSFHGSAFSWLMPSPPFKGPFLPPSFPSVLSFFLSCTRKLLCPGSESAAASTYCRLTPKQAGSSQPPHTVLSNVDKPLRKSEQASQGTTRIAGSPSQVESDEQHHLTSKTGPETQMQSTD